MIKVFIANLKSFSAGRNKSLGDSCYFHGGLYHWIEGSVNSQFLSSHAGSPSDGTKCTAAVIAYLAFSLLSNKAISCFL
jgi:hypothetical protein